MKLLLIILTLALSTLAYAGDKSTQSPTLVKYHMDGNGYIMPYHNYRPAKPQRYEDWTYIDENGLDYTVIIRIEND